MRLTDLEPEWVRASGSNSLGYSSDFTQAQGLIFACPFCFRKNGGLVGTHMVLIWFAGRGAPDECEPLPRWTIADGSSFENLTVTPSINLQTNGRTEEWHGWITDGEIIG